MCVASQQHHSGRGQEHRGQQNTIQCKTSLYMPHWALPVQKDVGCTQRGGQGAARGKWPLAGRHACYPHAAPHTKQDVASFSRPAKHTRTTLHVEMADAAPMQEGEAFRNIHSHLRGNGGRRRQSQVRAKPPLCRSCGSKQAPPTSLSAPPIPTCLPRRYQEMRPAAKLADRAPASQYSAARTAGQTQWSVLAVAESIVQCPRRAGSQEESQADRRHPHYLHQPPTCDEHGKFVGQAGPQEGHCVAG